MTTSTGYSICLRVDEFILDYVMYIATYASLDHIKLSLMNGQHSKNKVILNNSLEMVDSFLPVFRALHPDHHGDAYLQFRLRLLKFVSVLDSRRLRLQNYYLEPHRQGPQKYESAINVGGNSSPPNKSAIRTDNDTVNLDQLKPSASPSLLDTLPHFMALSAAQLMLQGSHITDIWMKLAAGYMTHAVLEQYFALGEHDPDVIRSTFAWGFDEQSAAEEGSEEFQINAMFFDEDKDRQVAGWDKTREDHTNALIPPPGTSTMAHYQALIIDEFPPMDFEQRVVEFLDSLFHGQSKPLLMQVGYENINGLSPKESRQLLSHLGIA